MADKASATTRLVPNTINSLRSMIQSFARRPTPAATPSPEHESEDPSAHSSVSDLLGVFRPEWGFSLAE
jgi:hypothetical protein